MTTAAGARHNSAARTPALSADHRVSTERTGEVPDAGTHRLNLTADSGSVRIFTDASDQVRYRVRVEAEAADPDASRLLRQFVLTARRTSNGIQLTGRVMNRDDVDRLWVTYEVHVPRRYDLDVSTRAGDIETQDIDGSVTLSTGGGTIRAGRIGGTGAPADGAHNSFLAQLETGGGHIFVGDVAGGLRATTTGGHIVAGNVAGDAVLHTDGGHIQVGRVSGMAQLTTGGGNIVAEGAGDGVVADSGGGRIELGEAGGAIRAHTNGGGIRIARLVGPTDLDSTDGAIFLSGVGAPLRAVTSAGTITAWFSPTFRDRESGPGASAIEGGLDTPRGKHRWRRDGGASELTSHEGNIIVYLPRDLAMTVDALVEQGSGHRIVADPSLPLKVSYEGAPTGRMEHGECALNGGGDVLRLRASGGDIELRVLDPQTARRLAQQQMEGVAQLMERQRALLAGEQGSNRDAFAGEAVSASRPTSSAAPNEAEAGPSPQFSSWTLWFDQFWWGGVRMAPQELQKRLVKSVPPVYPDAAQQAGIEGEVTLRILVGPDGKVVSVMPIAGEPVLERAAADAVGQWQYSPMLIDGRPVSVVTTVTLAFRLH